MKLELTLEEQFEHICRLGQRLTAAIQAGNKIDAEEQIESIRDWGEASDYPSIRAKAHRLVNNARLIGPADLVAFKVAEAVVVQDEPPTTEELVALAVDTALVQ